MRSESGQSYVKTPRIYVCEDSLEGILTAVHAAYLSRYGHAYQSIQSGDYAEAALFSEMIYVKTDMDKASRVADAIMKKISWYAWRLIQHAAMASDRDKADVIYRFLIRGFKVGAAVTEQMTETEVMRVVRMHRTVWREKQHMYGFIRFQELEQGILFARFAPKHHVLPLIAEHFADRYPMENWIIYDEVRHEVCVHQVHKGWWMARDVIPDVRITRQLSDSEQHFEQWWKSFYENIGIKERKNPRCRMTMMPKMYWQNMTEMQGR